MLHKLFSNTGTLIKFIFKRDRISISIWIICIVALTLVVATALPNLFKSDIELQTMAETMQSPAMIAMLGPAYGADNYTNGAMMSQMMLLFTIIAAVIMNIFLVVRHTRRDEEEGRIEVVRSLPVGRLSNLSATIIVCAIVNIVLALVTGLGLYLLNIESMNLQGSLLYGIALGISGFLFATITALFSQLTVASRGALGYSFAFLGISYLIRAGETSNKLLSYLSPLGLILKAQVYVYNYWWPVFMLLPIAIAILLIAFYLNLSRDLGEGIIPAKPGKKNASVFLQNSFGLTVRLIRNIFIGWAICMFLLGASYGSVLGDFETFLESSDLFKQLLNADGGLSMVEQFVTMLMSIMAIVATIPSVIMILKVRNEEKKGHSEHLLSRNVSRTKLLSGYFIISLISSIAMIFLVVFGLWSAAYAVMEEPIPFLTLFTAGIVYAPAIWLMISIALLLIAYLPRLTNIIWFYVGFSLFGVYLGRLLQLPDWVAKLSPFGHIPQIPVEDMNMSKLIILSVMAIVMISAGFIKYRKRDMIN